MKPKRGIEHARAMEGRKYRRLYQKEQDQVSYEEDQEEQDEVSHDQVSYREE